MSSRPPGSQPIDTAPLVLDRVGFARAGRDIIGTISLRVESDQRWVILGSNGSGKTTLLRIAALVEHPSRGDVWVLGQQLGRVDVRVLRKRIGFASSALAAQLRPALPAIDVVMTAINAALEPWWHRYTGLDHERAVACLDRMGVGDKANRSFGTLSSGEQQRVLLARTLMNEPAIVLLDEPGAGLDLAGREQLVGALGDLAGDRASPPLVLVTHHVDEIPPGVSHALLLRDGAALAQGPIGGVLTSDALSQCFGIALTLERRADGRLSAWARR